MLQIDSMLQIKNKIMQFVTLATIVIISCMILTACQETPAPSFNHITAGGTTDKSDPTAKKTIESKEIIQFATEFYLYDSYYYEERSGKYSFEIEQKENDEFVLNATGPYGIDSAISSVIPKEVLVGIQEIIDRYELVKNNGLNKVTAGLAPEYAPMYLSAKYASGEKLYFRENGDPDSEWTLAIRDYLEKALIEAGCDEVRPPEEELIISRFSLIFNIDEKNHYYAALGKSKDELTLTHTVYDMNTNEKLSDEKVMVTEDMLSGLQQVFEEYDFKSLHRMESVKSDGNQSNGDFLEIYVDYENGRQIYAQYGDDEIPENWPEMRNAFVRYCDEYMEKK